VCGGFFSSFSANAGNPEIQTATSDSPSAGGGLEGNKKEEGNKSEVRAPADLHPKIIKTIFLLLHPRAQYHRMPLPSKL
jgi:hypothetical protein